MDAVPPGSRERLSFGELLRRHRVAAGLTQEGLAERAHLSAQAITALERGTRRSPYGDTVRLLAEALGLGGAERAAFEAAARARPAPPAGEPEPVAALRPAAETSAPTSDLRTFLIADVRGYTRFTQEHGDEAAAQLADRFAAVAREGMAAHGGQVIELRGDEALAVFGSARQALRAALDLHARCAAATAADSTWPLRVGIGLDAGEAVPVEGGYRGGALNLAARLCGVAAPGEVLASPAVVHLARKTAGVAYLERGEVALKGLEEPVRVIQVLPEDEPLATRPRLTLITPSAVLPAPPAPVTDPAREFVFICYSGADSAVAARLTADLRERGITVWIDERDLQPGTPSWEQALRDAIRASQAVLLVASPHSRASRYIHDELEIARMYGRPVYPVWVAGDQWMECIPVGWGRTHYVDARGAAYAVALSGLVATMQETPGRHGHDVAMPGAEARSPEPAFTPRNPYKGLRPFTGADAHDFFGRERLIDELLAALGPTGDDTPRLLAVIGPSGSGKSSVVLAGLLPRVQGGALPGSEEWICLEPLVPGTHPLEALTVALGQALPGSTLAAIRADLDDSSRGLHLLARRLATQARARVVLVVDQFEELFTLTADEDERRHFIDLLVTSATEPRGPVLVLLTLRADFYDRPMSYPALGDVIARHHTAILPMTLTDLRAAIERPAALPDVRLTFEEDLVGDLLFEVRGQAGALPLLQFTLDQLFQRREGRCLTGAAYREMGGVQGALARHADAAHAALPSEEHRLLARALFLRLIDPGATEQDTTRRRAAMTELALPDPQQATLMREVLDAFIAARLVVTSEYAGTMTIEVSHEALIREWARLAEWLRAAR